MSASYAAVEHFSPTPDITEGSVMYSVDRRRNCEGAVSRVMVAPALRC